MKELCGVAFDERDLLALSVVMTKDEYNSKKGYEHGVSVAAYLRGASGPASGRDPAGSRADYDEAVAWAEGRGMVGHETEDRAFVNVLLLVPGAARSASVTHGTSCDWVSVGLREADAVPTSNADSLDEIPATTLRAWLEG